jgi:hypothetical protein
MGMVSKPELREIVKKLVPESGKEKKEDGVKAKL